MKKEYEKVEVSSKEEYEKLYFKCQGRCDNFCWSYHLVILIYTYFTFVGLYKKF